MQSAKPDDRRTVILECFQQVLKEEGFEGASMAKIAARVGVNPSLLLHYFPNKEEMIAALVDHIFEKYETLGAEQAREIDDPERRLDQLLDLVFGIDWISLVDSGAFYSCYSLSFRNARVKDRMQQMYQRFRERVLEEISDGIANGYLKKGDPETMADFVISLVEGLSFTRNISGGAEYYLSRGAEFKQLVREMLVRNDRSVTIASDEELVRFKQDASQRLKQVQEQLTALGEQVDEL